MDHPDDVANTHAAHEDDLFLEYQLLDPYISRQSYHERVLHLKLPRELPNTLMDIWDETGASISDTWGHDTENWKETNVYNNSWDIISRLTGRLFVGLPVCRNPKFIQSSQGFTSNIVLNMFLMSFLPKILLPILAPLLTLPNRMNWWKNSSLTIPIIQKRAEDLEHKRQDPDWKWDAPNDYLTWHLKMAHAEGNTTEQSPKVISQRIMPLMFASLHTTSHTFTVTLLSILGADPNKGFLDGIREEIGRVYAEANGVWTKASLARLYRTDSAIREAMRMHGIVVTVASRKVMKKDGIHNAEEGWTAPAGAHILTDVHSVHRDPEIYPNPDEYDAFRFSRPREEFEARMKKASAGGESGAGVAVDEKEKLKFSSNSLVATSDTFMGFGLGKHAWYDEIPFFFPFLFLCFFLPSLVLNLDTPQARLSPPSFSLPDPSLRPRPHLILFSI